MRGGFVGLAVSFEDYLFFTKRDKLHQFTKKKCVVAICILPTSLNYCSVTEDIPSRGIIQLMNPTHLSTHLPVKYGKNISHQVYRCV